MCVSWFSATVYGDDSTRETAARSGSVPNLRGGLFINAAPVSHPAFRFASTAAHYCCNIDVRTVRLHFLKNLAVWLVGVSNGRERPRLSGCPSAVRRRGVN